MANRLRTTPAQGSDRISGGVPTLVTPEASPLADVERAYRPGVCNIGPDEIRRRHRAGQVGLVAAGAVFAALLAVGAPKPARLLISLPAGLSAAGYLQARLRFCAAFGSRGVYNFGPLGTTATVPGPEAAAVDRKRARRIGVASLAIGAAAGIAAAALPIG